MFFANDRKFVQTDEQVYMALKSIEQGPYEKVEVYYEHILKLANSLQDKAKDSLFVTLFACCHGIGKV
jgi:hypothetical protein